MAAAALRSPWAVLRSAARILTVRRQRCPAAAYAAPRELSVTTSLPVDPASKLHAVPSLHAPPLRRGDSDAKEELEKALKAEGAWLNVAGEGGAGGSSVSSMLAAAYPTCDEEDMALAEKEEAAAALLAPAMAPPAIASRAPSARRAARPLKGGGAEQAKTRRDPWARGSSRFTSFGGKDHKPPGYTPAPEAALQAGAPSKKSLSPVKAPPWARCAGRWDAPKGESAMTGTLGFYDLHKEGVQRSAASAPVSMGDVALAAMGQLRDLAEGKGAAAPAAGQASAQRPARSTASESKLRSRTRLSLVPAIAEGARRGTVPLGQARLAVDF